MGLDKKQAAKVAEFMIATDRHLFGLDEEIIDWAVHYMIMRYFGMLIDVEGKGHAMRVVELALTGDYKGLDKLISSLEENTQY